MSAKLPPEIKKANKAASDKRYAAENREKIAVYQKQYRIDHPDLRNSEWHEKYNLKKQHSLTTEQKSEWLASQENKCAICGTAAPGGCSRTNKSWKIDHDHKTGFKRGLLCNACNLALGYARDNIEILRAMINYLNFTPDYNFEVV